MGDDALLATMTELANYLALRSEHRTNIEAAQQALAGLEDEIARLRAELAGHLRSEAVSLMKLGRPKGSKDKQRRGAYRPVEIASVPALEALEAIKAGGPEGVPLDKLLLQTKPWVIGLLARAHYARKLPNGNWVAA